MKIAFVNDTFIEGRGADTVVYELAKRIGKNHVVYVIASEIEGFKEENFKTIKINTKKLHEGNLGDLLYFNKIGEYKNEILKLQKIHSFNIFNVHHSALNPALKGLPTVVTWHGSPKTFNFARYILNKIILKTLNNNKKTIVISEYIKKELSRIVNKDKIEIIYDGVSNDFKPSKIEEDFILFVGRLEKHKEINELIKLSKELNSNLKIAGYGPEEQKLKDYAIKLGAPVDFLGRVSRKDLINLYKRCLFFVSASKWEGFGLIFIEAAASRKTCIGYDVCSIREVIKNNETGFLVKNYEEFKEKAEILIRDKKLRYRLGKNALNFSKNFDWNNISKQYIKLFEEVK